MENPGLFVIAIPWLAAGLFGVLGPDACAELNTTFMGCLGMDSGPAGNPRVVRAVSAVTLAVAISLIAIQLAIGYQPAEPPK